MIRDDIVVMTGGVEARIVFWLGGPAIARSQEGERGRMATWMEASIEGSEVGGTGKHKDAGPPIHQVIAAWRAADRALAGLVAGDPDWNRVHAELVGLRALHHRLFEARMAQDRRDGEPSSRWMFAIMAWGPAPLPAGVMA